MASYLSFNNEQRSKSSFRFDTSERSSSPMLAKAIGYRGEARFVSFQWTPYAMRLTSPMAEAVEPVTGKHSSLLFTTRQSARS
jgi:hypothetical protein